MTELPLVRELSPVPEPAECFDRLAGWPYRAWLDSTSAADRLGRYSFLAADPCAVIEAEGSHTSRLSTADGVRETVEGSALDAMRSLLAEFPAAPVPGLPPFQGGLAGYIGYEFGGTLERLPPPPPGGLGVPDVRFCLFDWVLAWDHLEERAWLISTGIPHHGNARRDHAAARMAAVLERIRDVPAIRTAGSEHGNAVAPGGASLATGGMPGYRDSVPDSGSGVAIPPDGGPPPARPRSSLDRAAYLGVVRRVREYILAGDIYQANITQRFAVPLDVAPRDLYIRLRTHNPAPFSAYLEYDDLVIASASPERFLRLTPDGMAEARPIKGTRPRGRTADDDAALARELLASEKDRAEHVMIVDLMRNDLGRVCVPGTVQVPELLALEHYSTVHHLVSTVSGQLDDGRDAIDLLRVTFPGGSITGAPKIRAMEIIAELEPVRRDAYCGTIAYLSLTGALDASIIIRTVLLKDGYAYCSAGGGIVADSDPEAEYAESWDKARGLLEVLGASAPAAESRA